MHTSIPIGAAQLSSFPSVRVATDAPAVSLHDPEQAAGVTVLKKLPLDNGGFRYAKLRPVEIDGLSDGDKLAYSCNLIDTSWALWSDPELVERSALAAIDELPDTSDRIERAMELAQQYGMDPMRQIMLAKKLSGASVRFIGFGEGASA